MDIHFVVHKGDILPTVESFLVLRQTKACPPQLINLLVHKIHQDLAKDGSLRQFYYPFKICPTHVTIELRH